MIPSSWTFSAKLCLCAAVLIVLSQATDADLLDREVVSMNTLRATTLDLATLDTANNTQKSLFFNIQGIVPGGFQVNSVRIKNDGELDVGIAITTEITAGANELCSGLRLKVLKNWQTAYDASLTSFSFSGEVLAGKSEDLVFSVLLDPQTSGTMGQTCAFNFLVNSTQEVGGGSITFSDSETLQNLVASGQWSQ